MSTPPPSPDRTPPDRTSDPRSGPSSAAVHAGEEPAEHAESSAVDPPVVLSSTFAFESADDAAARFADPASAFVYSRWRNPTVDAFERKIAALEGGPRAVALASGMAAVYGAITSVVGAGDHIVAPRSLYAETARALSVRLVRFGVETTFVDATDLNAVEEAMTPRTRVVYVETPANPTLAVTDIAAVAALARERGAVTVVDSTFATPYHQRPLALGADLVVHSATKAIGGHGDAIGGVVVGDDARVAAVHEGMVRIAGAAMSPWNAHMLTRGARTLALRAARMAESALALAERLEAHPGIERVWYPGLLSHPQHAVARRQMMRGYGGLVAVELRGGAEAGRAVYDRVRLFTRAVSLGDVRSLITHPATTTHVSLDPAVRRAAGIRDGTMRLSIGIEDMEDLWRDLERALHWR